MKSLLKRVLEQKLFLICLAFLVIVGGAVWYQASSTPSGQGDVKGTISDNIPALAASRSNIRSNQGHTPVKPPFPEIRLVQEMNSDDAVAALGDKLPEVAAWYGDTPQGLRDKFKKDKTLWASSNGKLFYKDENLPQKSVLRDLNIIEEAAAATTAPFPLEQTFLLHSSPNSQKVIYLDFDGDVLRAGQTTWVSYNNNQDIVAPAWNIDGNISVFGDNERTIIQNIWKRVAEDYAPFDVDITTEEPPADRITRSSSSDEYYGTKALISPVSSYFGNYGGLSYIGTFNDVGDYYKPSLVFSDKLLNGEKYMAECISHEVGHSVGLSHDGTTAGVTYYQGHGNWAPIMGNSYYKAITQWSKGEYTNANNKQDDLQVVLSYGLNYYPDDHSDTVSAATWLALSGSSVSGRGVIERTVDKDVFSFVTSGGNVNIAINPDILSPNLDIRAELKDAFGGTVAVSDNLSGLTGAITTSVGGGTYYLFIEGTGQGDPLSTGYSDYASLGQYTISGVVENSNIRPPVAAPSASPLSGPAPLTVQFTGTSSSDPDGATLTYLWNFGDGSTSVEPSPLKTFVESGTFVVSLTVKDADGLTDASSVTISVQNKSPIASLRATPVLGTIPLAVSFDGTGSYDDDGTILTYSWDFGDGSVGSGATASHTYSSAGTFNARLTVTDNNGAQNSAAAQITTTDPGQVVAPSSLSGAVSGSQATLRWTDNSNNETGFYIERGVKVKTKTTYTRIGTVSANVTSFTDNISVGTYYYCVQAYSDTLGKISDYSNAVQVRRRR